MKKTKKIMLIFLVGCMMLSPLVGCTKTSSNSNVASLNSNMTNSEIIYSLKEQYYRQNLAFQIFGNMNVNQYLPYSYINEDWLQNALSEYNIVPDGIGETLSLQNIRDFLSAQFDAQGKPITYLTPGYENIKGFVNWFWSKNGGYNSTQEYDENQLLADYAKSHPDYVGKTKGDLNNNQIDALDYKFSHPSYNLDLDNPDSWKALDSASSAVS